MAQRIVSTPVTAPGWNWRRAIQRTQARDRLWPLSVCGLVVVSCLLWIPYIDLQLHVDPGGYATAAYWWARGDILYRDLTITRPQGIFVIFRAIEAVGLGSARGIHLVAMVYSALCALALLAVASHVWGRRIGFGAALLFALVMATPYLEAPTANAELFMLLPVLASLYPLLRSDEHPLAGRHAAWLLGGCGFLGAIAVLIQPMGIAAPLFAALWLLRRKRAEGLPWRVWLRAEVLVAAGFVAGLAPALAHGLLTAPEIYLQAVLLFRLGRDSTLANPLPYQFLLFGNNTLYIVGIKALPVLQVGLIGLWLVRYNPNTRGRDLLWLWSLASLVGAALGGNWHLHYYQLLLPPIAVATAVQFQALLQRPRFLPQRLIQGFALFTVAHLGLTLATLLWPPADPTRLIVDYRLTAPGELPPPFAKNAVAAYLREHTNPEETIYVADHQVDVYYLAQRRPAVRWLFWREQAFTPGALDEQAARLANPATAPRYIVGVIPPYGPSAGEAVDAGAPLHAVVARDYILETTIGNIPVYRRKD